MATDRLESRSMSNSAVLLTALLLWACGEAERPAASMAPVGATFQEVFLVDGIMQLGEAPSDSIAEIGDFVERRGGGYVIADRFLPRVRSYDEAGRLTGGSAEV